MMRALWTAASGMIAQQTNVDNIAHNLANVNTTGYKNATVEFKTLLYQTIQTKTTTANGENKPIPAQVGLGVRNSSITTRFTQGPMLESANDFAFGIEGDGFFAVKGANGETCYTRNGDFQMAIGNDGTIMLCTSEGYPVLDDNGQEIIFDANQIKSNKLMTDYDGNFFYPDETNNPQLLGVRIGLYQFTNANGLKNVSGTLFKESEASGPATEERSNPNLKQSRIHQGYVEGSNVQVVDEMVSLISAQRAYEMNSKAIQASDEMLGQANQLKR